MGQAVDLDAGLVLLIHIVLPVAARPVAPTPVATLAAEVPWRLIATVGIVVMRTVEPPVWASEGLGACV